MKKITLTLLFISALFSAQTQADVFSEAHKLGSFLGAMKYCEKEYDTKGGRYRLIRLRIAREVNDMSGQNKTKALFASSNAERRGTFLGNKLNKKECEALLIMREWKRFYR